MIFLLIVAMQLALSALAAVLLRRRRPTWRLRQMAALAPVPLPALALAFCVWRFADAAPAPRRDCGVDACAMAMLGAMTIAGLVLMVYAVSVLFVVVVLRATRSPARTGESGAETFE